MLVSVVTPTYNCGAYLRGSIESVMAQGAGVEHIVVDGGSRDCTIDVLREYPGVRWISEADQGMYDAINKGIRMSRGEVVAYLNADDRYREGAVRTAVEAFESDPEVQFVYGYCEFVDENESPLCILRPLAYRWLKYSPRTLWPQPAWFWRREVHDRVGYFDASLRYVADSEFMRRLIKERVPGRLLETVLARFMLRRNCIGLSSAESYNRERMAYREKAKVIWKWTLGRVGIEMLFAAKNIGTYPARLRYRGWTR